MVKSVQSGMTDLGNFLLRENGTIFTELHWVGIDLRRKG